MFDPRANSYPKKCRAMAVAITKPDFSFGATFMIERPLEKRVEICRGDDGGVVAIMTVEMEACDGPEKEDVGISISIASSQYRSCWLLIGNGWDARRA